MPNSELYTAIGQPRYSRYLAACGNKRRALKLYRANISLSQKMYAVIGMFEVILRNSIDRHMKSKKGPIWLEEAIAPDGFLYHSSDCRHSLHVVQKAIHTLGSQYTHDRLIANLTFGFWRYQFARKEYLASGNTLLNIFINRPFKTNQKDIFRRLIQINQVRNRIAHHEPICFDGTRISTEKVKKTYNTILELLEWLGCNHTKILYGIDSVRKSIDFINSI